jgi:hypothetical protein
MRMTKEFRKERDEAFRHAARQYLIRCARHAMPLAPLPEFEKHLQALELYDAQPTRKNRTALKIAYADLVNLANSEKPYSRVVKQVYWGLRAIIDTALNLKSEISNGPTFFFAEAKALAVRSVNVGDVFLSMELQRRAREYESAWQGAISAELFGAFYEKYDNKDWREPTKV